MTYDKDDCLQSEADIEKSMSRARQWLKDNPDRVKKMVQSVSDSDEPAGKMSWPEDDLAKRRELEDDEDAIERRRQRIAQEKQG